MALFPTAGRTYVQPPTLTPAEGGIFQAAEVVDVSGHELMGVAYDSEGTYNLETVDADLATCITAALAEPEGFSLVESEDPFEVNAAVKCFASGGSEQEYLDEAERRITASSQREVEQWLWEVIFPAKAVDITPGGTAVKAKLGLGLLQEYAGKVYNFVPTLHFGKLTGTFLASADLVKFDEDEAAVQGGAQAVNGAGYFSKAGPGGVAAGPGEAWLYMTGQIVLRQSEISTYVATEHEKNQRVAYGLRTYLATIDGFVAAIKITLE